MRIVLIGMLGGSLAAGCFSVGVPGGVHVGPGDAPVRRGTVGLELSAYGIWERVIVNPYVGASLGPLGARSEATSDWGLRVFADEAGRRPGLYGRASFSLGREDCRPECSGDRPTIGRRYTISAGLAKMKIGERTGKLGQSFAAAGLGLVYTRQDQDGIGAGNFFGIELIGQAGLDFFAVFSSKSDA